MVFYKGINSLENSDDFLTEILLRLPSRSIFKFSCVSTRWNNVITDSYFRKLYIERTRRSLTCSYPHGRLLGLFQSNTKHGSCIHRPFAAKHSFMPLHSEEYVRDAACGGDFFPVKKGYFITSSKDGLFLCGLVPKTYYVGNPITGKWETLPPAPLPQGFPKNCLSVGFSSNEEDDGFGGKIVNFRVIIATGCEDVYRHEMLTGSKVIPIETYSSRTRKWRRSRLISEIPVQIMHYEPPSFTGGYFHWFTRDRMNFVAYDPSSLDEEDNEEGDYDGGLLLTKKKHVVEVTKLPSYYGSDIIWRSDNGQTIWYGNFGLSDGMDIFRKRDDGDDWVCISRLGVDRVMDMMRITEKDYNEGNGEGAMVHMIAFIPWDPKLVMIRNKYIIYVYNCVEKKLDCEVMVVGERHHRPTLEWQWCPYFHSLSKSNIQSQA